MQHLGLRIRVFLFFGLIVVGSLLALVGAATLGYRQLGDPDAFSAFVTTTALAAFCITGLTILVWLLFDENVSKPIDVLAAHLRVGSENASVGAIDEDVAKYLGDLAPAASAIRGKLRRGQQATEKTIAQETDRLRTQRSQLLRILSDIPVAVLVARADHQIVLYDGQAAELMESECPARLGGSVFDYLEPDGINLALQELQKSGELRREIQPKGLSGTQFNGHVRRFEDDAGYMLMLEPLRPDAARPLVFDLDLLTKSSGDRIEETPLRDLSYVVFDCETTGLNPDTDEVIQIGAVRVVNGKIVDGEAYDRLVNPGRPIPASSTKVHHIDDAAVANAPAFRDVCTGFHQFAQNAILLAHNAPFDMSFLRRESERAGYEFDNPVLDTVHLSAIVFGGAQEHTLDALCLRLGITIPEVVRHTGLGDAIATARAFVAMLPILEARGLDTYGAVRAEAQKHQRILKLES